MAKNDLLNGTAVNPKDPLPKLPNKTAAALMQEFAQLCHQASMPNVIDAAGSLLVTCLRQRFERRAEAEAAIDEIFGRMKQALVEHYDGTTGRKKGVFPYDQHLHAGLIRNESKFLS